VEARSLETLSRRPDVRHLFHTGRRAHLQVLTLVVARSLDGTDKYLFVAGKKVGGAVVRNRVKRRMRAMMRDLAPDIQPGFWIGLIAGPTTPVADYAGLLARVKEGLTRLGAIAGASKAPEA
jgi:ribonuclease P protein component